MLICSTRALIKIHPGRGRVAEVTLVISEGDPTSVMWPLWQGRTCLPVPVDQSGAENATCTLGGYPVAAVNVSTVAQVQLAVNFARNAGLRLVIKNTGHCFLGKSAGAGALAIWLHNLGGIEFLPRYHEPGHGGYAGKAIKVGPAVTVLQAYEFAHEHEVSVLGGIAEVSTASTRWGQTRA